MSIWDINFEMPSFPSLDGDKRTDVLVVGGGICGLLCAYKLKCAGIDCILVEKERICSGITKNTTAKLTSQHGLIYKKIAKRYGTETAAGYYSANELAIRELNELCKEIDCDFERRDAYVYSISDPAMLEGELEILEKIGASAELASAVELPFDTVGAIKFPNQAQFHPLKLASAIAERITAYENTKVLSVDKKSVLTDKGRIEASKIIIATHFPFINRYGMYFLKMYQQRSYVLGIKTEAEVKGMYIDATDRGLSFRSCGDLLLLGGGGHRTGETGGGYKYLTDKAKELYPDAETVTRWATQDCITLDGIPYIGRYSRLTPELLVATGFNKWGMTSSAIAASLLCDIICGKDNPYIEIFDPSRSMLSVGLLKNALKAVKNMLTPTVPRCSHMGCALKYNKEEHTWDCPCHGSRFTEDKKLIDNPAKRDIN